MANDRRVVRGLALALALVVATGTGYAATDKKKSSRESKKSERQLDRERLETAVEEYKASLETLIESLEKNASRHTEEVEKLRSLVASGVVARREIEKAETDLASANAELSKRKLELEGADQLLAEAEFEQHVAAIPSARGGYRATAAVMRSTSGRWSIHDIGTVQSYFSTRFGRQLPMSAYGQTPVHNRLGWDHSNSVDVAVHPDSAEGQAIIAYLRGAGIPFLAFRSAVPGKATGAHIHIGFPSHRFR